MFLEQNKEKKIHELILENERFRKEMDKFFSMIENLDTESTNETESLFNDFKQLIDKKMNQVTAKFHEKKAPSLPQNHWLFVR